MLLSLSIVIPTYDREQVLCDTVRQLLDLTDAADEIVVVDQTPQHESGTEAVLSGWDRQDRIRWIRHEPPGAVGAMNRGLREAEGDIVLFLDDDIIPDPRLVSAHRGAHAAFPEAAAVVGQVLQPEDWNRRLEDGGQRTEDRGQKTEVRDLRLEAINHEQRTTNNQLKSGLRRDLDFRFNSSVPAWVENVMAGNLSVKKEVALRVGGFDENFIPPVSFRFETEFAKRLVVAGERIRFEPAASIRHLRAGQGGTRSRGSHLTSASPLHGVGDYYYALRCGKGANRLLYIICRPFREVRTTFHLTHPWYIPVKLFGELRAICLAFKLAGSRRRNGMQPYRYFCGSRKGDSSC